MGWENFHSVWDDPVDPPQTNSGGGKRKAKKALNWWEEYHESDSLGTAYDSSKYSYKEAFDDSDASWYKRSSFKYSRYEDYSPSRLFRSSFVGFHSYSTYYSDSNDIKNKAIRALRTLTRNANTLVDAAKKINYNVQFSAGVDSNGLSGELSAAKKQTIFVSPDKLVGADTPDAEDAVIDALTGFVLLRVQLAQTVPVDVIKDINAVSASALPARLAEAVYNAGVTKKNAETISAEFIDPYLAGMLAKSMLTRLCRRSVVADWGGFAPYFVRHAKQYAETGEQLKTAPMSVEACAGKIAYNMIADETAIEIEPAINDIVNKHLGTELEQRDILNACLSLIQELRQYFLAQGTNPAGEIENAITEGINALVDANAESAKKAAQKEEIMRNNLEDCANFLDSMHSFSYDPATVGLNSKQTQDALAEAANTLARMKFQEKLMTLLKTHSKTLKDGADGKLSDADMEFHANQLAYTLSHYNSQIKEFEEMGVDATLLNHAKHASKEAREKFEAQADDVDKFLNQARKAYKERFEKMRKELIAGVKNTTDKLPEIRQKLQELADNAKALSDQMQVASAEHNCRSFDPVVGALQVARSNLMNKIAQADKLTESLADRTARKISAWQSFCAQTERVLNSDTLREVGSIIHNMAWHGHDTATQQFVSEALNFWERYRDETELCRDITEWHKSAIDNFVNRKEMTQKGFNARAMEVAHSGMFDLLRKQFTDSDGNINLPNRWDQFDELSENAKEQFENLANSFGMSVTEFLQLLQDMEQMTHSNYDTSDASKVGEVVREQFLSKLPQISPIDEQLFGQPVQKLTAVLDTKSIGQVNDEARNEPEEEYIAYIGDSANEAKPNVRIIKPGVNPHEVAAMARAIKNKRRGAIDRIRNALCFQGTKRTGEVYGTLSGDLDEGGLYKLQYDSEHIWSQKQIMKLPDVAVGILVDQSGSMCGMKIDQAREMCIILAEAVKKIEGIHLHIYGHSANMGGSNSQIDLTMFEHYSSHGAADNANLDMLGGIMAYSNNYDGYAIKEAAKLLDKDPAKRKYLFVISDGLPHGRGYGGADAKKHVTSVCSFVRNRLKIPTYAFAVGVPTSEKKHFEEQYGKDKVIFLSTVDKCLPQIVRFLHSSIQREKKLVSVEVD